MTFSIEFFRKQGRSTRKNNRSFGQPKCSLFEFVKELLGVRRHDLDFVVLNDKIMRDTPKLVGHSSAVVRQRIPCKSRRRDDLVLQAIGSQFVAKRRLCVSDEFCEDRPIVRFLSSNSDALKAAKASNASVMRG